MKLKQIKQKTDLNIYEVQFLISIYRNFNLYYLKIFIGNKSLEYRSKVMNKELEFLEGRAIYDGIQYLSIIDFINNHLKNRLEFEAYTTIKKSYELDLENEMELFCFLRNFEKNILEEMKLKDWKEFSNFFGYINSYKLSIPEYSALYEVFYELLKLIRNYT